VSTLTIRQRYRSWRARRRVDKALNRHDNTQRREFVYLDEVSVYSLIASRLGPVVAELTESQSSSLSSESSVEVSADAVVAKGKVGSKLQESGTRGTQVLRKATVQATFKQLLEVERTLIGPVPDSDSPPFSSYASLLDAAARNLATPWMLDPEKIKRGELIEVEVEVEVDPIFRVSSIIGTMTELLSENPSMTSPDIKAQFKQAADMNRILEKFMVGLIPLKCRAIDYYTVIIEDKEWIVHRQVIDGLPASERPPVQAVYITGVTEERLYWKDIRRTLFSGSRFQLLCRINHSGVQSEWMPVKLVDVLGVAVPNLADQMHVMGRNALEAMASATSSGTSEIALGSQKAALVKFGRLLAESRQQVLSDAAGAQIAESAGDTAWSFGSIDSRRAAFGAVQDIVEGDLDCTFDATLAADFREHSLRGSGFDLEGHLLDVLSPPIHSSGDTRERIIDTEIIAIYW
jgi:hypothetical protein